MPDGAEARAMTVREVASYLNVNEKTVYRLAQRRDLPGFKVAGAWRFQRVDIDAWIEERKNAPDAKPEPRRASGPSRRVEAAD